MAMTARELLPLMEAFSELPDDWSELDGVMPMQVDPDRPVSIIGYVAGKVNALTRGTDRVGIQSTQTEACDSGSVSVTETATQVVLAFNQCRFNEPELGLSFYANGTATVAETGPASGYQDSVTMQFSNLQGSLEIDQAAFDISLNGAVAFYMNGPYDARLVLDIDFNMAASCQGLSEDAQLSYDLVAAVLPDGIGGFALEIDGSMTTGGSIAGDAAGTYGIETVAPLRFTDDEPYAGTMRVTYGSESTTIEYVSEGLYVDGTFYTLDEFEDQYMDEHDFDELIECFMNELGFDLTL